MCLELIWRQARDCNSEFPRLDVANLARLADISDVYRSRLLEPCWNGGLAGTVLGCLKNCEQRGANVDDIAVQRVIRGKACASRSQGSTMRALIAQLRVMEHDSHSRRCNCQSLKRNTTPRQQTNTTQIPHCFLRLQVGLTSSKGSAPFPPPNPPHAPRSTDFRPHDISRLPVLSAHEMPILVKRPTRDN